MMKIFNRRNLMKAGALILAALVMAAGLELLSQRILPPVYLDREVDVSADPTLIQRGVTYITASGREALKEEWSLKRLLAMFALQLVVLTLVFPLGLGGRMIQGIRKGLSSARRALTEERKRCLIQLLQGVAAFLVVFFLARAWILDDHNRQNWMTDLLCVLAGICGCALVTFRRTLGKKPEVLFLVLTLIYGSLQSWVLPTATGVSMDDGYHYQHAVNYSTLGRVRFSQQEWDAMQEKNEKNYRLDQWNEWRQEQNEKDADGAVFVTSGFHIRLKEYWMAAGGLGLFLGRLLRLGFWEYWALGRFASLAVYAMIGYFAIRRLKSGKMVMAAALMIPSNVFLAGNYSYDPGVTAGIWLSFAYWMAQWQERDQKMRISDAAVMILGMMIACFPKAIYFPLFLMLLVMPKEKFRDQKQRRIYWAAVLLGMVLVMAYILLPLGRSEGQGDTRADGDVNTFGQIMYILRNPLTYLETLWHSLKSYLDPERQARLLSSYGYQGGSENTTLCMMILFFAVLTDCTKKNALPELRVRLFGEALLLGTAALTVTSMYVWFTPVGASAILGVQPRYLLPLVYPAMSMMGSDKISSRLSPALRNGLIFAGMTFILFSGIMVTCVEYYHVP